MAYTINKTNGDILATVVDGTINDSTTSLSIIGRNAIGFGEKQNENFIKLLENFSANTAPTNAMIGQLWFQSNTQILNYYTGTEWKGVAITSSSTTPLSPVASELWWDTAKTQLKLYSGTEWIAVAPSYDSDQGKTGAIVETIYDLSSQPHYCVVLYSAGTRVAVVNSDAEFTPNVTLTGFSSINSGITVNSNNSLSLGSITVSTDSDNIVITNNVNNADTTFKSNVSGTLTTVLQLDGVTGELLATTMPTTGSSLTNKDYVDSLISSTATLYAPLDSATLTGTPRSTTPSTSDNSTRIATTAFTKSAISGAIGDIPAAPVQSVAGKTGSVSLTVADISGAAPLNNAALTGVPTAPTPLASDSTTRIATTAFVQSAISVAADSRWEGSSKYVSTNQPTSGDGTDGDFWFKV